MAVFPGSHQEVETDDEHVRRSMESRRSLWVVVDAIHSVVQDTDGYWLDAARWWIGAFEASNESSKAKVQVAMVI